MICVSVPLAKSAEAVSVATEGTLEATESKLELHLLRPPGSTVAAFYAPDKEFYIAKKRAEKPSATGTSPQTRKKLSTGVSRIKLTVLLASSRLAKSAEFSQNRYLSAPLS